MQKVAVITGMNSMDGKTLTHILLSKNYHVVLTKRYNDQNIDYILNLFKDDLKNYPYSKLTYECMDLLDRKSVESCIFNILKQFNKIDEFYHLAGFAHVGDSFKSFSLPINTNGFGTYYILETLKNSSKDTKFYFANTSECFGGDPKNCPFREVSPQELRSPYSLGKNLGANITKYYRQTYGMYACFGWLFNHSNYYRKDSYYFMKVIKSATNIYLGKQKELFLGNLNFSRDEHLSDFGCEMMWKMLNNPKGPIDYVVGNGKANSGEEYLFYAFRYYDLDWTKYVKFDENLIRPNEVVKLVSDPTQAVMDLGWIQNRITLKQHVDYVTDYVLKQESGEQAIRIDPFELFPVKKLD